MKLLKAQKNRLIVILILCGLLAATNFDALMAKDPPSPYENEELSLHEVAALYHKRVNEIFNSKIKLLLDGEKGGGTNEIPDGDDCEDNNYTTYCLAVEVSKEYEQYRKELLNRRQQVPIDPDEGTVTLDEASARVAAQANKIQNEIERGKKALDVSLQTYDELSKAYSIHLQYREMIENLSKYTQKLAKIREQVEKLPGKFIDATTAECT